MSISRRIECLLLLFFVTACQSPDSQKQQKNHVEIADILSELNTKQYVVEKTIVMDGVEEQQTDTISDLTKELAVFLETSLNKTAYLGYISIDSMQEGNRLKVTYALIEKSFPLKQVEVIFEQGNIVSYHAVWDEVNKAFENKRELWLEASKQGLERYKIKETKQLTLAAPSSFTLEAICLK